MQRAKIVRLVAVLAMMLGVFSFMAAPASAQGSAVGVGTPCQTIVDGVITTGTSDANCAVIIGAALPAGVTLTGNGDGTFNLINSGGATIQQGRCPGNIIVEGNTIQFACGTGVLPSPTPTATPVTPTATPVTPTATPVTPTATPVTPTATPVTPTPVGPTPTATPVTPTATVTPDDDDDDTPVTPSATVPGDDDDDDTTPSTATATTPAGDDDDDAAVPPVSDLPSTGQGPTQNDSGMMALVLGAAAVLLAGVAFVWQRRGHEV